MTCAGVGLAARRGRQSGGPRDAVDDIRVVPPHLPSTRTGRILAAQSMPAVQAPSFVFAPMMPATPVPCHELSWAAQSSRRVAREDEVTGVGRVGIAAVAVVRRLGGPETCRNPGRKRPASPGVRPISRVDDGDDDAGGPVRDVPRREGADRARSLRR